MATTRTAAHVWFHLVVLAAVLGACVEEDPEQVGTSDGAVQPGGFDAGAFPGGGVTTGGGTTGGGFPGAPGGTTAGAPGGATTGGVGGGTTGGGTTGGTTGGGTTGFFGGTFGGGFPGGMRDAGRPDASAPVDAGPGPMTGGDAGPDTFAELRQVCVDTINMHRATLGLAPLARANATQENCSDLGAAKDGMSRAAHSSAGGNTTDACKRAGLGAQNTCPGWPVGGRSGNPTLADALKRCLAQMWAENEPPNGVQACIADRTGCFQMHGHWINMTSTTSRVVSCGFYDMGNNTFWMNQDFGR